MLPISPAHLARLAAEWPRSEPAPPPFRRGDRVVTADGATGWVWSVSPTSALVLRGAAPERLLGAGEDVLPVGPLESGTVACWVPLEELHRAAEVLEPQPLAAVAAPPAPPPPKPSRPPAKPGPSRNRSRPPAVW